MQNHSQVINNRYRLLEKLGQGGMGSVYRAVDRLTGQTVALKRVSLSPAESTYENSIDFRMTLANEFKVLASLRHPHIITVLDYGFDEESQPFFTMEIMDDGQSFLDAGKNKPLSVQADYIIQLLQAVAYLHRRNILHRDLKPGNVLVDGASIMKVLDFGLAAESGQVEEVAGTVAYMAPEVLQGYEINKASDLYSIGVMAYELISGQHPFVEAANQGFGALVNAVLSTQPDFRQIMWREQNPTAPQEMPTTSGQSHKTTQLNDHTVAISDNEVNNIKLEDKTIIAGDEMVIGKTSSIDDETLGTDAFEWTTTQSVDTFEATQRDLHELEQATFTLSYVLRKLLSKSPVTRYEDAYHVIDELCNALDQAIPQESEAIRESYLQAARFVGRDSEIAKLESALEQSIHQNGQAWLISGESGVGKSRLMDELRVRALVRGVSVLRGKCVDVSGASYQLWREPLRRVLLNPDIDIDDLDAGILKDIVPDIENLLGRSIIQVAHLDGEEYKQRLTGAITSVLQRISQPTLLLLEDLQWIDESLDILKLLCGVAVDIPMLIVGNYRNEERADISDLLPEMQLMRLERLGKTGIQDLSLSILGEAGERPDLQDFLHRETEGNVLFIIEVLRALAKDANRLDDIASSDLPQRIIAGGIQSVIQQRLDRVHGEERYLLQLAAISGREIDLNLIRYLNKDNPLDTWLTTCSNFAVVEVVDETWQFSHDKLREGALITIDSDMRPIMHRQVADAIQHLYPDQPEYASVLADHWHEAGNYYKECVYAQIAGLYAMRLSVFADARDQFKRALLIMSEVDEADLPLDRQEVEIKLAEVLQYLGEYDEAIEHAHIVLKSYKNKQHKPGIARVSGILGDIFWEKGDYPDAIINSEQSLQICRELDHKKGVAKALNRLGIVRLYQGKHSAAEPFFIESLAIAKSVQAEGEIAVVVNNLGLVKYITGQYDEAKQYFEQTLEISRKIGERRRAASALLNLGSIAGIKHNYGEALGYFEETLNICREIGDRRHMALSLHNLGVVSTDMGNYENAEAYLEQSWVIAEAIGYHSSRALSLFQMGDVKRQVGHHDEAIGYYRQALETAHKADAHQVITEVFNGLSHVIDNDSDALFLAYVVISHPATYDDVKKRAETMFKFISASMSEVEIKSSVKRAENMSFDDVVAYVLTITGSQM